VVFIESKAFTRRLRELAKDESDAVMIEIQKITSTCCFFLQRTNRRISILPSATYCGKL